eukprot:3615183-Pleurochrysis_carterae.AAC.1
MRLRVRTAQPLSRRCLGEHGKLKVRAARLASQGTSTRKPPVFFAGASLAFTWVLAGLLTGVFSRETRYDRPRVVLTCERRSARPSCARTPEPRRLGALWFLAAPSAQLLKEA